MTTSNNILQIIGIAGAVVAVSALIPYYVALLRGTAKPSTFAQLIFGVLATIAFFSQLAAGAQASLWFAFVIMLNPFIIISISLKKGGASEFATRDKISLVLALAILIVWYFSKSAALAIVLVTLVNTIGKYLVAERAYRLPHTDVASAWAMTAVASALTVISVGKLDWVLLLVPVQNMITVAIIAYIIATRQKVVPVPEKL